MLLETDSYQVIEAMIPKPWVGHFHNLWVRVTGFYHPQKFNSSIAR